MVESSIRDPNDQMHDNLPTVLAGRGGGTPGRQIKVDERPTTSRYTSLLNRIGAPGARFADSPGMLEVIAGELAGDGQV